MKRPPKNTGIPYELALQRIFQEIHDRESGRTIKVEQNVRVEGRSTSHQIDLLWNFTIAGIDHLTIVQARDWNQSIKQEAVSAFNDILKDIPGQPRGVIVTRTGFQRGAKQVAEFHGIKLFTLRQGPLGISIPAMSYADLKLEGYRLHGGGQGVLARMTVFRPEFSSIEFTVEPSGHPPKGLTFNMYEVKLYNANKEPVGTLCDIMADFLSVMKINNQQSEIFAKDFPDKMFFQSPGYSQFFQLQHLQVKIDIVKEERPPIYMKPPGFVDFVLEDLDTGKKQSFIQPAMKKGK